MDRAGFPVKAAPRLRGQTRRGMAGVGEHRREVRERGRLVWSKSFADEFQKQQVKEESKYHPPKRLQLVPLLIPEAPPTATTTATGRQVGGFIGFTAWSGWGPQPRAERSTALSALRSTRSCGPRGGGLYGEHRVDREARKPNPLRYVP